MIRRYLLVSSILCLVLSTTAMAHESDAVATQSQRAEASSGYTLFPNFPRLEIVQENVGTPNRPLADLITDAKLKQQIDQGYFTSLQVRDLAIQTKAVYAEGETIHFPYALSVKHTEGHGIGSTFNQGTIDVAGEIQVRVDGQNLIVTVIKYDDSQTIERVGRYLGFNGEINLDFAKNLVKPELETWFNADPSRIHELLNMANRPSVVKP